MYRGGNSKHIIWLLIMLLLVMVVPSISLADDLVLPAQVNYLALGDSLAAGYTPYPRIVDGQKIPILGDGYPDFIAEKLADGGRLRTFDDRYAVPGYTTEKVLSDIVSDKQMNLPNNPDLIGLKAKIQQADMITLDAGANDLFLYLEQPGGPDLSEQGIRNFFGQVAGNLSQIMLEIKTLNPKAKVYLMGYYNAYPYAPVEQQEQIRPIFDGLNQTIQDVALQFGATYVPTYEALSKHTKLYLPNPENVHPSLQGYRAIAKEFWQYIKLDLN